jgi:hypothetical protein
METPKVPVGLNDFEVTRSPRTILNISQNVVMGLLGSSPRQRRDSHGAFPRIIFPSKTSPTEQLTLSEQLRARQRRGDLAFGDNSEFINAPETVIYGSGQKAMRSLPQDSKSSSRSSA